MREFKDLRKIKEGDWIIFSIIKPITKGEDKRNTLIKINPNKKIEIFAYDYRGLNESKILENKRFIKGMKDFYGKGWSLFKLNKKEKTIFNKKLILENL